MKKRHQKIQKILSTAIITVLCTICVATAWATVTLVKPQDAAKRVEMSKRSDIPAEVTAEKKTRAPEPTTMALFGGGFLGMIASFVRKAYAAIKRFFDIVGSVVGMVILAPVMLFVALLVKITSKGPIIYSQTRVGKSGNDFNIYKFRTMKVDAEKMSGPVWATENDNRLTIIGQFLRKAHLDELPQFVNVAKGEMSLIGPRPERPVFVKKLKKEIPGYEGRLAVKPGITGLAQVWHRYDETIQDVKKKVKYDLLYIRRMCLWADISIFFRTIRVVFTGEGAR